MTKDNTDSLSLSYTQGIRFDDSEKISEKERFDLLFSAGGGIFE